MRIRLLLDYGCGPVWLYDESGGVIDTVLPDELKDSVELQELCDDIEYTYEGLFTNNSKVFEYNGFRSKEDEDIFVEKLDKLATIIEEKLGDKYIIVNDFHLGWDRMY